MDTLFVGIVIIILLGIASQIVAWFTRLPSILVLIIVGVIAGPVLGFLHPDAILGGLVEPIVALAVAVILFEGGLNLKYREIQITGPLVLRLTLVGGLVTWVIGSIAAVVLLDLDLPLAILLGAILIASGPTVILPLLRYFRPGAEVSAILKWEGILIDPIGAILALMVLEVILAQGGMGIAVLHSLFTIAKWALFGGAFGLAGALLMVVLLRRHLLPDFLHVSATLGILAGVFALSELIQPNSGLLAAIIMGAVLANQRQVNITHIVEFKENLRVLLISFTFIILSARLESSVFNQLSLALLGFILLLVLVARPLAVFLASLKSKLMFRQKLLLSSVAPRGIVSASVASIFTFRLAAVGFQGGESLLAITFIVIFGTILTSSLFSSLVTKGLHNGSANQQGIVFFGGQIWVREAAALLLKQKINCLIIDNDKAKIDYARRRGIDVIYTDALESDFLGETDFSAYGYGAAVTADDNFNQLVVLSISKTFGSSNVFLLTTPDWTARGLVHPEHLPGRILFGPKATYEKVSDLYEKGKIRLETLGEDVDEAKIVELFGADALPMLAIEPGGKLTVIAADGKLEFKAGTRLFLMMHANKA